MNRLQEIFFPTDEEKINQYERIIDIHNKQIGCCSTCIHHIYSNLPGFIVDYGDCKLRRPLFYEKVTSDVIAHLEKIKCPYYEENRQKVESLIEEIKRLKERQE